MDCPVLDRMIDAMYCRVVNLINAGIFSWLSNEAR